MRSIKQIIIHCADTYPDMDVDAATIRKWHVEGNGWDDIGYHYVITRGGYTQKGREEAVTGAHAKGMNYTSIGICLVGGKSKTTHGPEVNFTTEQWTELTSLVLRLIDNYPEAEVIGHCDIPESGGKTCPNFNVRAWWND